MKYYYAFKVLLLNILASSIRRILQFNRMPVWFMEWIIKRYIYNLTKLATLLDDKEMLEVVNTVKKSHEERNKTPLL